MALPVGGVVPEDDLPDAVGSEVPEEDLPEVPQHDLPAASASPDLEAYSGGAQQAIAGVEGLAKGIAGPLATWAETKMGVSPEGIAGRAEANPWTHGAAEAVGLVGAPFIPGLGEVSLGSRVAAVGKGAQAAAKAMEVGKVGQAAIRMGIEGGVFHLSDNASKMILGQTDPEAPVSSFLAGTGAATLLGSGLGALGGKAAVKLEEMASGKAANRVSQWLADLGSRFDLLSKHGGLEGTTEAAAEQAQHLYDTVNAAVNEGFTLKRNSIEKLTQSVTPEKTNEFIGNMLQQLRGAPKAMGTSQLYTDAVDEWAAKAMPGNGRLPTAADIFEATDDLKRKLQYWSKFEKKVTDPQQLPFVQGARKMSDFLKNALEDSGTWGEMGDFQKQLNSAYSKMLPTLKDFTSAAMQKVGGEPQIDKGKLFNLFRQLGKGKLTADIRADKVGNFFGPAKELMQTVHDLHAAQGIESSLPFVSTEILDEMLRKELSGGSKVASWLFDSGQAAVGMGLSHAVGTAAGAATGHPYLGYRAGETLYPLLKEMGKKPTRWAVSGALRAMAAGEPAGIPEAIHYAEGIKKGADRIENSINNVFKVGGKQYLESDHDEKEREKLKKFIEEGALDQQIQNQGKPAVKENEEGPKGFAAGGEVLAPQPAPMAKNAGKAVKADRVAAIFPEQAMLMGMAKGRVNNYLNQIRPQKINSKLPFDEAMPNREHERSYHRALDIANKPLSVLDHIKNGTLEPEHVQHINGLYPELTNHLRKRLTEKVVEAQSRNEKPPAHIRQSLSLFMGAALDSNLTPANIMAAQATFANSRVQTPAMPAKPSKALSSLENEPDQYRTSNQSAQLRQHKLKP